MDVRLAAGARLRAALGDLGDPAIPGGRLLAEPVEVPAGETSPHPGATLTFDGEVELAGRRRLTTARLRGADRSFHVAVEGIGGFAVEAGGGLVRQLGEAPGVSREALLEAVLGPPLVLALALRGVFCLHASAAAAPRGGAALFLGESGHGKSTLAAHLDAAAGWRRLTDDVTPVDGGLRADPRFPQLSLPPGAADSGAGPEPVAALLVLRPAQRLRLERLPPGEAAEAVVRQTVAARLFDPELLAAHLEWATRLAEVGVHHLDHPHGGSHLPAVVETVERLLAADR